LRTGWHHALQVADIAAQLAADTGRLDPAEAYLSGLLHDVGRIALVATPAAAPAEIEGCAPVYAENLVLGVTHAAIGARIGAEWRLPEAMIAAIAHHHTPEETDTEMAGLLYLAEELSGSDEDLPSVVRFERCLKGTGLTRGQVLTYRMSELGHWLAAA
jgi:putative nucleotidyltransferase with HDIG domain